MFQNWAFYYIDALLYIKILEDMLVLEKIAVMVVTSSADRPQIYSERVRNLSGFNHTKLEQDGGNPVRLIQDLLQA